MLAASVISTLGDVVMVPRGWMCWERPAGLLGRLSAIETTVRWTVPHAQGYMTKDGHMTSVLDIRRVGQSLS